MQSINQNPRILLSRNSPVALVVGAASFFGSHLTDKLLKKEVQVIGVDDLNYGEKRNLSEAFESKNFHFLQSSADNLELETERLDYIFIIPCQGTNVKKVLEIFKKHKSRLLLLSSIDLYEKKEKENNNNLKEIEEEIAEVAKGHNLNARILRLGAVYGPRMQFNNELFTKDPLIKLIQQSLSGDLQKEISLDFSSRALFIDDVINLAIKCVLAGATAQKIFDGVLPNPVKVSEAKQILLDPVWYESKHFTPSELPPWVTPNLDKTIKFLNWKPQCELVLSLRKTLSYFKDNEIEVPEMENKAEKAEEDNWKIEKAEQLKGFKEENRGEVKKDKKGIGIIFFWLGIAAIIYGLIWPIFQISWGVFTFRYQLLSAVDNLGKGEPEKSLSAIKQAENGIAQASAIYYYLEPIRSLGLFKTQFETGDKLINLATLSADGAKETILGIQALVDSLKSITGESSESPEGYFESAKVYLQSADVDLSKAEVLANSQNFKLSLSERLSLYANLVKKGRALASILPEIVALDGKKSYLVLVQNNSELRPTGGLVDSFARVTFERGKLVKLKVDDVDAMGQLKDSNWEPDFPTSAKQAEWFYTKETGERVEGVLALDLSAIKDLLGVIGSLNVLDDKVDAASLFEKANLKSEEDFLTSLTTALFNKLFFLPNNNWSGISASLGKSLETKHMSVYLNNPILFSYIVSQNWGGLIPRPDQNKEADFLASVEANMGANKANYYLNRNINLETTIGKDGEVSHNLRIAYVNSSPKDVFPAGKYKNRMRVYLPMGSKLIKASWGEADITKEVTSFVDYGRSGYSFLTELAPKEQKTLTLSYQTPVKLKFTDKKASYKLDVVKQAGTNKDPFIWKVFGPQEYSIQTDLLTDKTFQLEFNR